MTTFTLICTFKLIHTNAHHVNSHSPGKPVPLTQSPLILILSILMRKAKTLCIHMVLQAAPPLTYINHRDSIPRVLKKKFYGPDALPVNQPTIEAEHVTLKLMCLSLLSVLIYYLHYYATIWS